MCCCIGKKHFFFSNMRITAVGGLQQISGEYKGHPVGPLNFISNMRWGSAHLFIYIPQHPLVANWWRQCWTSKRRVHHLHHMDPLEIYVWGYHTSPASYLCVRFLRRIYGVAWCRKWAMKCSWRSSCTLDLFRSRSSTAFACDKSGTAVQSPRKFLPFI